MTVPTTIEVDCSTGEQVEREMTESEIEAYELARSTPDPAAGPSRDEQIAAAIDEAIAGVEGASTPAEMSLAFAGGLAALRQVITS